LTGTPHESQDDDDGIDSIVDDSSTWKRNESGIVMDDVAAVYAICVRVCVCALGRVVLNEKALKLLSLAGLEFRFDDLAHLVVLKVS
jgi:hypothetical protein